MDFKGLKFLVVGAGFSGSVIAERIANELNEKVLVIDNKNHIGGNSYSEFDATTGIECHKYGSHIFHTSLIDVWEYINQFTKFNTYQHKVLTTSNGKVYQMPINLKTINDFFDVNLKPYEAAAFFKKEVLASKITSPKNLEEKAISLIGEKLYSAFIKEYTQKQWGCDPKELSESIINRLPVRMNYNANYFNDPYQGIPLDGYAKLFENILNQKNIEIQLGVDFFDIRSQIPTDCKIIYTGMVDKFFDYKFGELSWRSLKFDWEIRDVQDYQGTAVMNYADSDDSFTRIHEFKHYHTERELAFNSAKTIICREYPQTYKSGLEAYYPVDNQENNQRYALYQAEALKNKNLILAGRLGMYKYWDMDKAIYNALVIFENLKKGL